MTDRALDIDLNKRTVRNTVTTKLLARDGGIVMPGGIVTRFYEDNPIVKIRHGYADDARPLVAGRALELIPTALGLDSVTQFADTELGREWGYMYGLNQDGEVFMRAFSFGWQTLEHTVWRIDEAQEYLGPLWDDEVVPEWCARYDEVWVAVRSEMHEYSVVEVGADREALTRAWKEHGLNEAGNIIARLDLRDARTSIDALRASNVKMTTRLDEFEKKLQALSRDGAEAARRGDSSELVSQLRELTIKIRGDK